MNRIAGLRVGVVAACQITVSGHANDVRTRHGKLQAGFCRRGACEMILESGLVRPWVYEVGSFGT
jgi:hypothetical protein